MSDAVVGSDPVDEIVVRRPLHPMWDRLVPPAHRRLALWVAGSAAVLSVVHGQTQRLFTQVASAQSDENLYLGSLHWWLLLRPQVFLPLAAVLVAIVVWAVLRYTSAPRAVVLYLVLSPLATAAVTAVRVVAGYPMRTHFTRLVDPSATPSGIMATLWPVLAFAGVMAIGTTLGAWLSSAMSDSDTGRRVSLGEFVMGADDDSADGPDAPEETALPVADADAPAPATVVGGSSRTGFAAIIGWEGWSIRGSGGIALAAVALPFVVGLVGVVPGTVSSYYQYSAMSKAFTSGAESSLIPEAQQRMWTFGSLALMAVVTAVCYWWAVRRASVSPAVWVVALASSVEGVVSSILFVPAQLSALQSNGQSGSLWSVIVIQLALLPLVLVPLFAVWIATGRGYVSPESDTLPAEEHAH